MGEADAYTSLLCELNGMPVATCKLTEEQFKHGMEVLAGKGVSEVHVRPSGTQCAETYGAGPGSKCQENEPGCTSECQEFFEKVQESCEPGDTMEGGLRYATY